MGYLSFSYVGLVWFGGARKVTQDFGPCYVSILPLSYTPNMRQRSFSLQKDTFCRKYNSRLILMFHSALQIFSTFWQAHCNTHPYSAIECFIYLWFEHFPNKSPPSFFSIPNMTHLQVHFLWCFLVWSSLSFLDEWCCLSPDLNNVPFVYVLL